MSTSIPVPQQTRQQSGSPDKPKPNTKTRAAKPGQKATGAHKGAAKPHNRAGVASRPGSKTAKVLHLLQRSGGATLNDLMKVTHWQAHSVRGFLSGTLRKKMGLAVTSTKIW